LVTKGRVLLVEDDGDLRAMLAELLADHGFEVAQSRNGQEALDHLERNDAPGAIVLDHIMPVMDAGGFLAERARRPALARIPVVLLTASEPASVRLPEGVEPPLIHAKPVDLDRLVAVLAELCA
jgi:chemosensory pili system protein ChpA (sensor histidine kinase/response regulator)